jgi:hypothetical protein
MSASPVTMVGPLPDISMIERFRPIWETIFFPVSDDPVNPMASMPSWVTSISPTSPSPGMIEMAPLGTPASSNTSAISSRAHAVNSGGLTITALPVARPGPTYSIGIITGKFHGVIAAHTPDRPADGEHAPGALGGRDHLAPRRLTSSAAIWK